MDKLDVDKPKAISNNLTKLSNIVKKIVNGTVHGKLITEEC